MMQADVQSHLDERTRESVAAYSTEGPGKLLAGRGPLFYAAALTSAYLLRRVLFNRVTLLAAGGYLAYTRLKGTPVSQTLPLKGLTQEQATFTINRSADELYDLWHNIETSPLWMESIRSVTDLGNGTSHWVMDLPGSALHGGQTIEWDAQWTAEEPGKRLAWHSVGDAPVPSAGQILFEPAVSGRGTVVRLNQEFLLPGGKLAAALGGLFSRTPGGFVRENLRHFKQLAEAGEVPTTRGQAHGTRGLATPLKQAAIGDQQQQPTSPATGGIAHPTPEQAAQQEVA